MGISDIFEDRAGGLWIATSGSGLLRLNPASGSLTHYRHDPNNPNSLHKNGVSRIYEFSADPGAIWLAIGADGLDRLEVSTGKFTHFLSERRVTALFEDHQGTAWIGSDGLGVLDLETGTIKQFFSSPAALRGDRIWGIYEDRNGLFWAGGTGWVAEFNRQTERFNVQEIAKVDSSLPGYAGYRSFVEDANGRLWTGSRGLSFFDASSNDFSAYDLRAHLIDHDNNISEFVVDQFGSIWVATWGGLIKLEERRSVSVFQHDPANTNTLNDNRIRAIWQDEDGRIWIGHNNRFIDSVHPETLYFRFFGLSWINRPYALSSYFVVLSSYFTSFLASKGAFGCFIGFVT